MLDLNRYNDIIYHDSDQVQKTNTNQLQEVEERHGDLQQLEVI